MMPPRHPPLACHRALKLQRVPYHLPGSTVPTPVIRKAWQATCARCQGEDSHRGKADEGAAKQREAHEKSRERSLRHVV